MYYVFEVITELIFIRQDHSMTCDWLSIDCTHVAVVIWCKKKSNTMKEPLDMQLWGIERLQQAVSNHTV